VITALARNMMRWTAVPSLPGKTVRTGHTVRRWRLTLPGRLTRHAGTWTLRRRARWPWNEDFTAALSGIRALSPAT
jgi:hypothetical protein